MTNEQLKRGALYIAGLLVTTVNTFLIVMTAGFGIRPEPNFKNTVAALSLYVALLSVPAFLITIKWSRLGYLLMCWILVAASVLMLLSGMYAPLVIVLVLLVIQTVISNAIHKDSPRSSAIGVPTQPTT